MCIDGRCPRDERRSQGAPPPRAFVARLSPMKIQHGAHVSPKAIEVPRLVTANTVVHINHVCGVVLL